MDINYCQKETDDGILECGFLVGAYCKADRDNPFLISGDFHSRLMRVGCQSWQRYLDYDERRKRFGNKGREGRTGSSGAGITAEECQHGADEMQKLSEQQTLGGLRADRREEKNLPVRNVQAGPNSGRNSDDVRPVFDHISCTICGKPAVVKDMRQNYCEVCAAKLGLKV